MASKETTAVKNATNSYVDLSSQTYATLVEAYSAANKRALDYTKSFWEIASRPYSTAALEAMVQDSFDRANKLVALTVTELQNNGHKAAELAETFAAQAAKFQESYTASMKGLVDTGISNLDYVKDAATQQFEDITKRMDEIQKSAVASVSSN